MSKNVAVFVDVANIFYAAKAAGVDIDYVTLLKSASAGRDLVRAYAYTGLDPDNENQRNFHSFLARHGYRVVSKDIRKYGDGKVKANLDIELVVDMMKTARNLDIAIVVSGDGDFAPAIRAVQEMGVRVEVISFRGNTSSDLIEVADQFTDITALAKVEKGSSRSGRRVAEAGDDEDLSMTEVPDKQTEGAGDRRGRGGRGRGGRGRPGEAEPVTRTGRGGRPAAAVTSGGTPLVVLPGERLSRVAPGDPVPELEDDEADTQAGGALEAIEGGLDGGLEGGGLEGDTDAEGRRRRRRRGGRGRGRGRGREEGTEPTVSLPGAEVEGDTFEAPRAPRTTPFGSVWDSQLGVPSQVPAAGPGSIEPFGDDEDFEEPEIPEYLLAERHNRGRSQGGPGGQAGRGGRGGPRGNRAAYAAAIDRERYGRGGGGGGINRYPDLSARERPPREPERGREPRRDERGRDERFARPAGGGGGRGAEEWSEVPPELEAMLRAQISGSPGRRPVDDRRPPRTADAPVRLDEDIETFRLEPEQASVPGTASAAAISPAPAAARRGRRPAAAQAEAAPDAAVGSGPAASKRRPAARTSSAAVAGEADAGTESAADAGPKRRTTRRKPADEGAEPAAADAGESAPKRRASRRSVGGTATAEASDAGADAAAGDAPGGAAPKRRTTRRKPEASTPDA